MSTILGMEKGPVKAVLDTNILVSAIVFGGKPEKIFQYALKKDISVVTSPYLMVELNETLIKKFSFSTQRILQIEKKIKQIFLIVNPNIEIHVLKDEDDSRVLEAAIEGRCSYIITGDKELLELKSFKNIEIITASNFLEKFG